MTRWDEEIRRDAHIYAVVILLILIIGLMIALYQHGQAIEEQRRIIENLTAELFKCNPRVLIGGVIQ